jgi:hypothetical protein
MDGGKEELSFYGRQVTSPRPPASTAVLENSTRLQRERE